MKASVGLSAPSFFFRVGSRQKYNGLETVDSFTLSITKAAALFSCIPLLKIQDYIWITDGQVTDNFLDKLILCQELSWIFFEFSLYESYFGLFLDNSIKVLFDDLG